MSGFAGGPVLLLVNPTAGRGRGLRLLPRAIRALEAAGFTATVSVTDSLEQATERARAAARGSLVAGGRGNDTIRRLGLDLDPAKAIGGINGLAVRELDLGLVDGRAYLGVANVGFDGLANEYGNSARMNLGPFTYLYGGLKALVLWRNVRFTLTVDGRTSTFPGWFIAVGNVGQYGGGLRICPEAKADDGLLDVVSLGHAKALGVALTFLRSYRGSHLRQANIGSLRGRTVEISANKPLNIYADGEMAGPLPATIRIGTRAVGVLAPADSPAFGRTRKTGFEADPAVS